MTAAGNLSRTNSRAGRTKTAEVSSFGPCCHVGVMIVEGCNMMLVVLQTRSVCLSYLDPHRTIQSEGVVNRVADCRSRESEDLT